MGKKSTHYYCFWVIFLFFQAACGTVPAQGMGGTTPTINVTAIFEHTTGTAVARMTQTAVAIAPTVALPTEIPLSTPTPGKPFTLETLRAISASRTEVYEQDGNVYIKDGLDPARRLTHGSKDHHPLLSDDGQKVVFYRGVAFDTVYSINVDGTLEKAVISNKTLPVLGRGGNVQALTFRPQTHELLFNTYLCEPKKGLYVFGACTVGIFDVDIDTGEIKELAAGLSGNTGQERNFEVSPNGFIISISSSGHIDLGDIYDGSIFRQDALVYQRTKPDEFLPYQYWLPNSKALIAVVSADYYNEPGTPPQIYSVWRYNVDDDVAVQLPFDPPVRRIHGTGCNFSVSPDRNWIFYASHSDDENEIKIYLGNLNTGHVQEYKWKGDCGWPDTSYLKWSPNSRYFADSSFIGSVDGSFIPVGGGFIDWIDSTHYYFYKDVEENGVYTIKTYAAEVGGASILVPTPTAEK